MSLNLHDRRSKKNAERAQSEGIRRGHTAGRHAGLVRIDFGSMKGSIEILGDIISGERGERVGSAAGLSTATRLLSLKHQDLADRFLAATAQVLNLTLVTADTHLLGLGEIATLANR